MIRGGGHSQQPENSVDRERDGGDGEEPTKGVESFLLRSHKTLVRPHERPVKAQVR